MFPTTTPRRSPYDQQFGPASPALIAACQAALAARAKTALVRPVILGIQAQVLAEGDFQIAPHWVSRGIEAGRITEPAGAYEMEPERFTEYYELCAARYRAAGYEFPEQQCPLAIAEHEQAQAELAFGLGCKELRIEIDPEKALGCLKIWKEYLETMFAIMQKGYLPK
jgi:hypothetical protein